MDGWERRERDGSGGEGGMEGKGDK